MIAIWLLRGTLFPQVAAYHLPFGVYNPTYKLRLTEHLDIHVIELPKWRLTKRRPDGRDRWVYFFKEGKHLDPTHPPDILQTKEMQQAMNVLVNFSEQEKNYLLYEQRLEAERVESTWREMLEKATAEVEQARQEREQERQARELAYQEKEQLLQEMERLQQLLQQAGIDPDHTG